MANTLGAVELRRVASDRPWAADVNRLYDVLRGDRGGRIKLWGDTGEQKDLRNGTVAGSGHFAADLKSGAGRHQINRHSGTGAAVFAVTDAGVAVTGTLTVTGASTLNGTLGVTGATTLGSTLAVTGATTLGSTLGVVGEATFDQNIAFKSGTGFAVTLDHAATANHTVTYQDLDGAVALLGALNAGHLLFADNLWDIGQALTARPRNVYAAGAIAAAGALSQFGVPIAMAPLVSSGSGASIPTSMTALAASALTLTPGTWLVLASVNWLPAAADVNAIGQMTVAPSVGHILASSANHLFTGASHRDQSSAFAIVTVPTAGSSVVQLYRGMLGGTGASTLEAWYVGAVFLGKAAP